MGTSTPTSSKQATARPQPQQERQARNHGRRPHRIQSRDERRSEGREEDQAAVDRGPQGERKRQERLEVRAQEVRGKIREGDGLVRRAREHVRARRASRKRGSLSLRLLSLFCL